MRVMVIFSCSSLIFLPLVVFFSLFSLFPSLLLSLFPFISFSSLPSPSFFPAFFFLSSSFLDYFQSYEGQSSLLMTRHYGEKARGGSVLVAQSSHGDSLQTV